MSSELLSGFVLFPSENGDAPSLLPCFVRREHVQIAQLPDVVKQLSPQRRQATTPNVNSGKKPKNSKK